MSDGEALLRAAADDVRESLPALMYADWCDESSRPLLAKSIRIGGLFRRKNKLGSDGSDGYGSGSDGGGFVIPESLLMLTETPQLMIIYTPSGYAPLVRVGWMSCRDYWVLMQNCRVVRRFGGNAQIANLAKKGPIGTTELLDLSEEETAAITACVRVVPCNEKAWIEQCPKPDGV